MSNFGTAVVMLMGYYSRMNQVSPKLPQEVSRSGTYSLLSLNPIVSLAFPRFTHLFPEFLIL